MIHINDFSRKFEIDLYSLCENSPYGARIISYHTAYHGKKYGFLDFWIQRDGENSPCCAFCRYYSTLIICGNPCSIYEAENFVKMLSPSKILCDGTIKLNTDMTAYTGETMACTQLNDIRICDCQIVKLTSDMANLKKTYSLLQKENSEENMPEFENYFLDISYNIRHGVSEVYGVFDSNGNIISTSAITARSDTVAVIGCVATDSNFRKQGFATALVHKITKRELSRGKTVYLHREREIPIYEKIGFITVGEWREFR